jgi:cysteine desulfurase
MDEALSLTGDPGRVYQEAQAPRVLVEQARESLAQLAGCRPGEVVFTSGATESANWAAWGAARLRPGVILSAAVEHSAVRAASARWAEVVEIGVDPLGRIHPAAVEEAAARVQAQGARVCLVQCQWANHEVGTLQPVAEVAEVCARMGALLHVDAASGFGRLASPIFALGADLVSISGHKFGGPAGTGALLVRRGLRIEPWLVGGDQERGRRAGLENVAGVAGLGAAASALGDGNRLAVEARQSRRWTERILALAAGLERVSVYGDPVERVPHLVCLGVEGVEAEAVVIGLDQAGVAVHSGSACSSEALEPSPVLTAMGVAADRSLRLSVGWSTRDDDIEALEEALPTVIGRLRALAG